MIKTLVEKNILTLSHYVNRDHTSLPLLKLSPYLCAQVKALPIFSGRAGGGRGVEPFPTTEKTCDLL